MKRTGQYTSLWKASGAAGLIAAATVPLFVLLFYGVFPRFGFEPARFADPAATLSFFAAHPALIRLTGLVNLTTMTASILLALGLGYRLWPLNPSRAVLGSMLSSLGWLLLLVAEHADLAAFVYLSPRYPSDPALVKAGFAVATAVGRSARGWGYLLLAGGLAAFAGLAGPRAGWPATLGRLGWAIVPSGLLLFLFDSVLLLDTGSPAFGMVFTLAGGLLAVWNGWVGLSLWREGGGTSA